MQITAPSLPSNHPDRPLACEEALHEGFYGIAAHFRRRRWAGDESELWPLRREARAAGWEVDEIDAALGRLAKHVPEALEPGRPG